MKSSQNKQKIYHISYFRTLIENKGLNLLVEKEDNCLNRNTVR